MTAHITSFVLLCRPSERFAVRDAVAALPGVEVYRCGDDGKIIALAEGGSGKHIGDTLMHMQNLPGVVAANMAYHGIAEDDNG